MFEILILCFIVMLVSLSGVITLSKYTRSFVQKHLYTFMSFAIGVFGVVAYLLLREALEHGTFAATALSVCAGFLIMTILPRLISDFHHHHTEAADHTHSSRSAVRILASDAVHNMADGILITASFLASGVISIGVALSIIIHELVQEITEFFVLKEAGYSNTKALARSFMVSSTILIGAVGSYYFLERFAHFEPILLGVAAGGFCALLVQDLVPTSYREAMRSKHILSHSIAIVLGLLLMLFVNTYVGHEHQHTEATHPPHTQTA